jgi:hypothetical protein
MVEPTVGIMPVGLNVLRRLGLTVRVGAVSDMLPPAPLQLRV